MPVTFDKAKQDLVDAQQDAAKKYPESMARSAPLADDALKPYAQMSSFLTGKDAISTLGELEAKLLERYRANAGSKAKMAKIAADRIRTDKYHVDPAVTERGRPEDDPTRHLLSDVLSEWEKTVGLQVYEVQDGKPKPRMKPVYMVGTLSGPGFTGHLRDGHQAKDYVGLEHGVFSHRIQWYLIGTSKTLNLPGAVLVLFKQTGDYTFLWDCIFDRQKDLDDRDTDFRKPENLNRYLQRGPNASGQFPFLSAIVDRHFQKGDKFGNQYQNYIKRVIIKKLTGVWYPPGTDVPPEHMKLADSVQGEARGYNQSVLYPQAPNQGVKAKLTAD